ncbi:arylsulfatase [uncultured Parabacteroides sp.]|jgi:arylsulfatase A|uniref:sulfatase family protein n=1 Tax=uncultured Parabacteroides sp. TaxID=512312 RepID=UPI0025FB8A07|nr:arylsulfatase [uncultured Parabacteroides sp.]
MKKRTIIISCLATGLAYGTVAQKSNQPNIIFILADDLGYGDLSSLNKDGKIQTPHLDRLAENGVVFRDAHSSSAVSTPTRYGVLTGRYNWRSTLKRGVLGWYAKPLIAADRTTMGGMLRSRNYNTACIGKWHLGMSFPTKDGECVVDTPEQYNLDFTKEITGGPCDIGFDYFFGVDAPNYPPYCFIENRKTVGIPDTFYPVRKDKLIDSRAGRGLPDWKQEYILPALTDKAVEFINQSAGKDKPFFLYFPLTSPHTPIVPSSPYVDQSKLNLYADFVVQTDAVVGSLLKALEDNGIAENTIVVFTSDNGCSPNADFDFLKERGHDPSYIFRGMKSDLFEGGHHIPCIVSWPGKVSPHIVDQTICLTDFMRTFASIVGYTLADNEAEDSYDILPLLVDSAYSEIIREATVHHSINGSFAIRQGKWKLLLSSYSGGWSEPRKPKEGAPEFQLYDLEQDPEESDNLYGSFPDIAEKMRALLIRYVKEGRSTPGIPQKNDDPEVWEQLNWME